MDVCVGCECCVLSGIDLRDNVEKYGRAGQIIDDNMAHAHCMLDT